MADQYFSKDAPNLFNHRVDLAYPNIMHGLSGFHFYGMRALVMSQPGDVVQLHPSLKTHWGDITEHLARVGVDHTKDIEWDIAPEIANKYPDHDLSVYRFTQEFNDVRPHKVRFRNAEMYNSKNVFIETCKELGVPVPDTTCYDRASEINTKKLNYPVVIKGAYGVQGFEVHVCDSEEAVTAAIHALGPDVPAQVQECIEPDVWGSVIFKITSDGVIQREGITVQYLEDKRHMGNRGCPWHDVWHLFEPFAEHLKNEGFLGAFCIDIAFTREAVLGIECNARFPGSGYPCFLANRLGFGDRWMSRNMNIENPSLDLSAIDDLLYEPGKEGGVVVYLWALPARKIAPLVLGSRDEQDEIYAELEKRLGSQESKRKKKRSRSKR